MEVKDYLAAIALVVSAASLLVSLNGARFARVAKILEMRNRTLLDIFEAQICLDRADASFAETRRYWLSRSIPLKRCHSKVETDVPASAV